MEVLNELVEEADHRHIPTPLSGDTIKYRSSVYADNLVIFLRLQPHDFIYICQVPQLFARASGLDTKLDKCLISPIRCSEEEVATVQQVVFPCQVAPFCCKYLGTPLSLTRLRRSDEQHLVDAVSARIPTWKTGLLNNTGRATLTKTTLSAILVHISIYCYLSVWAIDEIDRRRRAFLWSGTESMSGGKCRVAWRIVCLLKENGGLGVLDLRIMGYALWQR
jgi:hypothetical protein